jgi:hypothetical protein
MRRSPRWLREREQLLPVEVVDIKPLADRANANRDNIDALDTPRLVLVALPDNERSDQQAFRQAL